MTENDPEQKGKPERQVKLRTLAPEYDEDQHGIYVRHLEDAIREKKNRNIALTGRYGSGKSSVLDAFEKKHQRSTVRISINTLGPDEDDEDLTNRIQKELVKQLVYRLKPGQIRRSRFARPKPLTKWRAFIQAVGVSLVGVGLMWLLGIRPGSSWPGAQASATDQAWLGLLFFALVVIAVWAIRWLVGDRIVSEVTTVGTKIALGEGPTTYFDSFLDEIVAFFDAVEPRYVIFEDLDRFDDPQIFDSLRELNTLINASAHWRNKKDPVRFIYAIKDSLFEQLGAEPDPEKERTEDEEAEGGVTTPPKLRMDVAAAVVRRANRTKFFEVVIPIVPFISHRNARDHLVDALKALDLPDDVVVSRPLLDLVARHTTDMRLMINICNEFAVFAERLLWTKNPAPGMTADHLFALVAYKNFHLADFEAIPQGTSTLDRLERHHRDHVRSLIEGLQEQRRTRTRIKEQRDRIDQTAANLGARLRDVKDLLPTPNGWPFDSVTINDQGYTFEGVSTAEFWEQVATTKSFTIVQQYNRTKVTFDANKISSLFPEVMDSAQWLDPDTEGSRLIRQDDEDIATLRGADFAALARYERVPKGLITFDRRISEVLESGLARDLVRQGFLTRNYAEYSAIFYGSFVGVDVAFFYNHSVQPNEMYLDYEFTSENAVSNLLEQVPADFTSSVSALNIQVASYLLSERPADAKRLVTYVVTHDSKDVRAFLDAFLNTPNAPRDLLVQQLTKYPWPGVLEYLSGHPGIPDEETRLKSLDTALLCMEQVDSYEIGESTRTLLKSSHTRLAAVRERQTPPQTDRVFAILEAVDLRVADLSDLSEPLRDRIVTAHRYEITVPNLRLALGIDGTPTLDEVRKHPAVWGLCKTRVSDYITAMQTQQPGEPMVRAAAVLVDVLRAQHESWTEQQLHDIIKASAVSAAVEKIRDVPEPLWPAIVDAGLMTPTLGNVSDYANECGVDDYLAAMLVPDGAEPVELQEIGDVEAEDQENLAIHVFNAVGLLSVPARVRLVGQLDLESGIDLSQVSPGPDQLLARALEAGVLPDDFETFAHFAQGGWEAVSDAFVVSKNVSEFLEPALLEGFVAEFLESRQTPGPLRRAVVEDISNYIPDDDDARALLAAGRFASMNRIWLAIEDVRRIARVTRTADAVLPQLVHAKGIGPDDLVDILASLGEPYDKLAGGPGMEFDLPASSSNETLFKRLEADGRIKIVPKLVGRGRKVQNLA